MAPITSVLVVVMACLIGQRSTARSLTSSHSHHSSRITVVGAVYCDTCSTNAFTKHSYFLPGVQVQIRCKFKSSTEESAEQLNYSVNRTTNKHGVYKLEIPTIAAENCADGLSMASMCQATLLRASTPACSIPSLKTASDEISIKSVQDHICIYSLNALSYKPSRKNTSMCGNVDDEMENALEQSKCFFPWPNLPPLFKLPPFWLLPWPFRFPSNLPFPFEYFPPFPLTTAPPPPPPFWDPRTWIPSSPPPPS